MLEELLGGGVLGGASGHVLLRGELVIGRLAFWAA